MNYADAVGEWAGLIEARADGRPVHLVGWSFGGAVAHGVACELRRRGSATGLVAMLDAYPRAEWATEPPSHAQMLRSALGMLGVEVELAQAEHMSDREAARLMAAANPLLDGLPAFDPACMLENFHAGPLLERTARYERLDGPVLFFEATRTSGRLASSWRDWAAYAGELRHVPVDAAHQEMLGARALEVIGPELDAALRGQP